eukprot:1095926-Amphidinium_carterae.1
MDSFVRCGGCRNLGGKVHFTWGEGLSRQDEEERIVFFVNVWLRFVTALDISVKVVNKLTA